MWYFGSAEGSKFVEMASASNVKRTWVNYGEKRDWLCDEQGQGEEFLVQVSRDAGKTVQYKGVFFQHPQEYGRKPMYCFSSHCKLHWK